VDFRPRRCEAVMATLGGPATDRHARPGGS
jgi:hypothetical protein